MDDFAQTREADDLFESEISAPQPPPPSAPTEPRTFSSRGLGSSNGRGGGGRGGRGGIQPRSVDQKNTPKEVKAVEGAPEGPSTESKEAIKQVKQDRTLSGGLKKIKLTEEELSERLERARLNNERLIERRRKAEEDENSFQAQEEARKQADATKRVFERKKKVEQDRSRKELDDEREKNRQRKLSAVNSREWDSSKTEEDYNPKKQSSQYRRGAHGGIDSHPRGAPIGPRGSSDGPRGSFGGPRGSSDGPRGSSGGPRGSFGNPRGPRGSTNRGNADFRGSSRNLITTQEWPGLPPVANDKAPGEDVLPNIKNETIVEDETPTNNQPADMDGQTLAGDREPVEDKIPENASLDIKDHIKDTLSPLSPAVGGDSWAEQVESAS